MNVYTYINKSNNNEVIFTCTASSIIEADKLFFESTSIKVDKCPHIGCIIKRV